MATKKFYVFVSFPNRGAGTLASTYASTKYEAEDRIFSRYCEKMPNRANYNGISFEEAEKLLQARRFNKAIHIAKY